MEISLIVSYLIAIAFSQALILALLILSKKDNKENYLGMWFFVIAIQFACLYSVSHNLSWSIYLEEIAGALVFLFGPLFYFYLHRLQDKQFSSKEKVLHLLPALLNLITIPILVEFNVYSINIFLALMKIASLLCYTVFLLKKLNKGEGILDFDKDRALWLQVILKGILVLTITGVISLLLEEFRLLHIAMSGELLTAITASFFVIITGFLGVKNTVIFAKSFSEDVVTEQNGGVDPNLKKEKYETSSLDSDESKAIFDQLELFLTDKKLYKEPELSLQGLAKEFDIHPNRLSQIINQNTDKNFSSYINSLRITALLSKIEQGEHHKFTLLALAHTVGFGSKASFNRAFKKELGKSPSEYINELE